MRTCTIKKSGFTLVEMAIVVAIIGVALAAALPLYDLYMKSLRDDQTEFAVRSSQSSLGSFRSIYGRYPCPADPTLDPTNPNYGYEVGAGAGGCYPGIPVGSGLTVSDSIRGSLADPFDNVVTGILPFRTLMMQDIEATDGWRNNLTYSVTASLTDSTTYVEDNGGISVIDNSGAGNSVINPPNSAHFVLISHNQEDQGAFNIWGNQVGGVCAPGLTGDVENCDADQTFRAASRSTSFDDEIVYRTGINITPWQYSNVDTQDIHLRLNTGMDSVALGGGPVAGMGALDLTTGADPNTGSLEVKNSVGPDGIVLVENDPAAAGSGRLRINSPGQICNHDRTACFDPGLIAGSLADGEGMVCGDDEFMIGIANGAAVCSKTVEFRCPAGEYFTGIDSNGGLECQTVPPPSCSDTPVTNFCGEGDTLSAVGHNGVRSSFGGLCHEFSASPYNSSVVAAILVDPLLTTDADRLNAVQTYMNEINNENHGTRSASSCDLVRHSFRCENGNFNMVLNTNNKNIAQEKRGNGSSWPSWRFSTSSGVRAEGGTSPAYSMSGNQFANDCWCREDYRVLQQTCPSGVGFQYRIQRNNCPFTTNWGGTHTWVTVETNQSLCGCNHNPQNDDQACHTYFNNHLGGSGLTAANVAGTAIVRRPADCGNGEGVPGPGPRVVNWSGHAPGSPDLGSCRCPNTLDNYVVETCETTQSCYTDPVPCPAGTWTSGVSFTHPENPAQTWDDVVSVDHEEWSCPTGKGANITSPTDAGRWLSTVPEGTTGTCTCNDQTDTQSVSCASISPTKQGPDVVYERTYMCALDRWETPAEYQIPSNIVGGGPCVDCVVQEGTVVTPFSTSLSGPAVGSSCDCSAGTAGTCHKAVTGGYIIYGSCACSP